MSDKTWLGSLPSSISSFQDGVDVLAVVTVTTEDSSSSDKHVLYFSHDLLRQVGTRAGADGGETSTEFCAGMRGVDTAGDSRLWRSPMTVPLPFGFKEKGPRVPELKHGPSENPRIRHNCRHRNCLESR